MSTVNNGYILFLYEDLNKVFTTDYYSIFYR